MTEDDMLEIASSKIHALFKGAKPGFQPHPKAIGEAFDAIGIEIIASYVAPDLDETEAAALASKIKCGGPSIALALASIKRGRELERGANA